MSKYDQMADSTHVGALCKGRRVTPDDLERWERQRQARKKQDHTLNPYRY